MTDKLSKKSLIRVASAIKNGERVEAGMVDPFLAHKFEELSSLSKFMLKLAALISLFFASVLVIFPEVGEYLISVLPSFFVLPDRWSKALDYVWGLVGKPVGKNHLMYHVPNIIIYTFGLVGIRQLWKRVNKNNWKDLVSNSQAQLRKMIEDGTGRFRFPPGFSLLLVGEGDKIGRSLVADDPLIGVTISSRRQPYTKLWGKYALDEGDDGLKRVLEQVNAADAGEYVLFPVRDEHLFLPDYADYDVAPHRVDVAVRRIRELEKAYGWAPKRIIIVGDKEQKSYFITDSESGRVATEADEVGLSTISEKYENVTILDPTEKTLQKIMQLADGRKIFFRSSDKGVKKYSKEFYRRLFLLDYINTADGEFIVGYDISDLETEHQIMSNTNSEYMPVIISRDIFDALVDRFIREGNYIFIPVLVKKELQKLVHEQ